MFLRNRTRILPTVKGLFSKKSVNALRVQTPMVGARSLHNRRNDPFTQMENFMKDMEKRFWGEVNQNFPWFSSSVPRFRPPSESAIESFRNPTGISGPSDISTPDRFKLAFNFPQAKPEDIKVTLKDRLLTVEAKVEEKGEGTKMHQSLNYQYTIPESVEIEALESLFNANGVLTIEAPKASEAAPRTININRE